MNKYQSILNINLQDSAINGKTTFFYQEIQKEEHLSFFIIDDFTISISGESILNVSIEVIQPWLFRKTVKKLNITLKKTCLDETSLRLDFVFSGKINRLNLNQGNVISDDIMEINLYTPIIPLRDNLEYADFETKIMVSSDIDIIAPQVTFINDGYNLVHQGNDLIFLAVKKSLIYEKINDNIRVIWFTKELKLNPETILNNGSNLISLMKDQFGNIDNNQLTFIISPRLLGGGYSRLGYIVLVDDDMNELSLFRFMAHEIAHLWWHKAPTLDKYEDWLNESFAEYSSLMVVREVFGKDTFIQLIGKYNTYASNLPSIYQTSRNDNQAYEIFYVKGPIILYQLELKIGEKNFLTLLKEIHRQKISKTESLLTLIKGMYGENASSYLDTLLGK